MTAGPGNDEWQKLSPLLDQVLELAPEAREPWLMELAASTPGLADSLRDLLAEKAAVDTGHFLEDSPAAKLGQATLAGQRLGAYEIERLVGQGGMGAVWLARRCDGRYEGKAAVKLLNAALIGGPAEQRFIREGSVLAALQHPNIAHLIDAGVSPGGQPYLILEHIEGRSIDDFCEQERLGIRERLRVFLDVLKAVGYAHRYLVVHRDIKPSNILVTQDGDVKLLDFGIAALLGPDAGVPARGECTREIDAALTPEYAAPEQFTGQPVTTATDIYALGRVLYVLLGGQQAAPGRGLSAAHLMRDILEREPPLLSEIAGEGTRRLLRGDLDNIARKALKVDPAERYATVEAFADDLRRFLADEPVTARPDSLGYRVGKFVKRHRGGVLSATLTALALVTVTVFAVLQMFEARQQRDDADAARQRAEGYNTAITGLLSQAGPDGRGLPPDELLGRVVQQVQATFADEPVFLVDMLILISGRYFDLQNTHEEHATLIKAETVARASGDPSLLYRVQCNTVETELAAGREDEAEKRLAEARSLLPVIGDVPVLDRAACLRAESEMADAAGDLPAALGHLEQARGILEAGGNTEGNVYSGILSMLAAFNGRAGNLLDAHGYSRQVVDLDSRLGRQDSVPGMIARISLASSFRRLGQVQRAASIHRQVASDSHPTGPGKMLYGQVLSRLGDHDAALKLLNEAVAEIDAGGHEMYRIYGRLMLAQGLFLASRLADAERWLDEAASMMLADEAGHRELLVDAHRLRAEIRLAAGNLDAANEEISSAFQLQPPDDRDEFATARIRMTQSRLRLAQGDAVAAVASARAALQQFEQHTIDAEESADVGEALLLLAQAQSAVGDSGAARGSLARAATALRNGLGAEHELTLLSGRLAEDLR